MINAYLSHPICGSIGLKATREQKMEKCEDALAKASLIQLEFALDINLYIPAHHEPFVCRAWEKDYLTNDQILEIDCDIISDCGMLLVYCPDIYPSNGMEIEIKHAQKENKPIIYFREVDKTLRKCIKKVIAELDKGDASKLRE